MPRHALPGTVALLLLVAGLSKAQDPLYTPGRVFGEDERWVGTTVFHWFTSTGGQVSGPWVPIEGRENWTGDPQFWERQVKDMMDALVDVIHVIVIPSMEQQRGNLFIALANLRAQGYDVPKVVPFLDSIITWTILPPIDLATEAGKDAYVGQYIRFFDQYFGANADAYAESYLLHINQGGADRIVLNVWHTPSSHTANIQSLTRADVESRLAAEFSAAHPTFNNGIYQFCTPSDPAPGFCDEDIHQFSFIDYIVTAEHDGRKTAALMPAYWDQNVRDPGSFLARDGGGHYIDAWSCLNDIMDGGVFVSCSGFDVSDWFAPAIHHVHIVSWNEYDEGSGLYASDPGPPFIIPPNPNTDVFSATNNPREYIDSTAAGASAFASGPDRDARILRHDLPAIMYPGQQVAASVIVRNEGSMEWTGADGFKFGQREQVDPVLFGPGRYPVDDAADEVPVYGGIFRGRPIEFVLQLSAPVAPGVYNVHFQMVQEHVAWFGEELAWTIEVVPGAVSPSPADGATVIDPATTLSWTAGVGATGHEVYLGTDRQTVTDAEPDSPEWRGLLPAGTTTYDPPERLAQGQHYYWRIDEVQTSGPAVIGQVWSFVTLSIAGDFDGDLDVDQEDFGYLQRCIGGSGMVVQPGCGAADLNADFVVDENDLAIFEACMGGADLPAGCAPS